MNNSPPPSVTPPPLENPSASGGGSGGVRTAPLSPAVSAGDHHVIRGGGGSGGGSSGAFGSGRDYTFSHLHAQSGQVSGRASLTSPTQLRRRWLRNFPSAPAAAVAALGTGDKGRAAAAEEEGKNATSCDLFKVGTALDGRAHWWPLKEPRE